MKNKNSGVTASGPARPEFMNGDIYRDKYGGMVTIKGVAERRITYRREGYEYDCVMLFISFGVIFLWYRQRPAVNQPAGRKHAPIFRK
ncbi:bacteriophage protein [Shigella dysenteriae]|nr:bacteriophage protein [Shigella dysenteriae]